MTSEPIQVGDRVEVYLASNFWESRGWFEGTVIRIDPYTRHRRFYWVELDLPVEAAQGGTTNVVSILNPRNIRK